MVLHGTGKPRIYIDEGGGGEVIINLPYCDQLVETFTPDNIVKKLNGGAISITKRGYYYSALLDYGKRFPLTEIQKLDDLYDKDRTLVLTFYPRTSSVGYTVDVDPEADFKMMQMTFHRGHKGIQIKLIGIVRIDEIDLTSTS